jgi:hypothetical protein
MLLPAIHTVSVAPARHLPACEHITRQGLWHESPLLCVLQQCQVHVRWLLARYLLLAPDGRDEQAAPRHHVARRLCAEVSAEIDAEEAVFDASLDEVRRPLTAAASGTHRFRVRDMLDPVSDIRPGSTLFDARVLALGTSFERHLHHTMLQAAPVAWRAEGASLGVALRDRRESILKRIAGAD